MSMTSASSDRSQVAGFAAAEHQHLAATVARAASRLVGSVDDDVGDAAQPGRFAQITVGRHQHRDRTEPGQRGDGDQRAGPGLHQDTDMVALAHPDVDEAADHVVDAPVDRLVGVHPPVEEQELAVG